MEPEELSENKSLVASASGVVEDAERYDPGLSAPKKLGMTIFIVVFGFCGSWAAFAPIDGAAVATGFVNVRSYSKVVQHLEGGIISDIFVENGARVQGGQPILELNNTQSLAQLEIGNSQFIALTALETRLMAERDGLDDVNYPGSLSTADTRVHEESAAQTEIFRARKATLDGSIEGLRQRIGQLESQVGGLEALKVSKETLAASYTEELVDVQVLLSQGFSEKTRLRELERNVASFNGEAADLTANIASAHMQIGETQLQILQQDREFQNQVVTELGEVKTNLKDVSERITALEDVVARTTVRAPEAGIVNGLQVHTIGGVISPGMKIVDIVPDGDDLIIEAKVSPIDIDRVAVNQNATIRFSSFGLATVPTIYGQVINLSADRLFDQVSGLPYYQARVEVTPEGMEDLGDLVLMPGMPADIFIATGSRTFLQYLFKPFSNAIARSLRED